MSIISTVNASFNIPITEDELVELIKKKKFNKKWSAHIFAFFSDVPVQDIVKFAIKHRIPLEDIKKYYEQHVKNYYPNKELEDIFVY